MTCPSCGGSDYGRHGHGCPICPDCGFSECGGERA